MAWWGDGLGWISGEVGYFSVRLCKRLIFRLDSYVMNVFGCLVACLMNLLCHVIWWLLCVV